MFASSMPNLRTSVAFVDTATKCFATADSSPSPSTSHCRAARAFVSVSRVVNVFEETTNSVVAGSRSSTASVTSVGSMLETNRRVNERSLKARSAW